MRTERGMTLVEMLVAMTVFLVVLGAAMQTLQSQARSFQRGADETAILQNLRFGAELTAQDLRTAGANVPDEQPSVVYASAFSFAFNADYASNTPGDPFAIYVDPDAPAGHVSALTQAQAIVIPGSAPAFTYPSTTYNHGGTNSAAETITFFFAPDLETARIDDYVLLRQVNNQPAEPLVRNVLAYPGRAFFQYYYRLTPATGAPTDQPVPTGWLPLRHSVTEHGAAADTGSAARIDSLRAVEVSYRVTNGRPGAEERVRQMSTIIPLPNMGLKKLKTCGHAPLFGQALVAGPAAGGAGAGIDLSWNAAIDETGGEQDVIRYVVWRRVVGAADWGDPKFSVPAGNAAYALTDVGVTPGTAYEYAAAVQDCTPSLSSQSLSAAVVAP